MPNKNVLAILSGVVALGLVALAVLTRETPAGPRRDRRRRRLFTLGGDAPRAAHRARAHGHRRGLGRRSSSTSTTSGASSSCALVFVWAAFGLLPVDGRSVAAQGGLRRRRSSWARSSRCGRTAAQPRRSGGKLSRCPRLRRATASASPSRPGSTSAAACASSTRSRSRRRSATSATTTPTTCARSWRRPSASTPARAASRATSSAKLEDKVHVAQPEAAHHPPEVQGPGRQVEARRPLQQGVPRRARRRRRARATNEITFKIRADVESQIRERAVAQAKDTVNRRVDELGLREAARHDARRGHHRRGPRQRRGELRDIKETIRKTARLEFKMVDDAGSDKVFGPPALKDDDLPAGEGIAAVPGERARRARRQRHRSSRSSATTRACRASRRSTRTRR